VNRQYAIVGKPHATRFDRAAFFADGRVPVDGEPPVGRSRKRHARIFSRLQESITRNAEGPQEGAFFAPFLGQETERLSLKSGRVLWPGQP
jgi:hypothetical protein